MQNIVVNMFEKFHDDRLKNDKALGDRNSDNNPNKNNKTTLVALGPLFGVQKMVIVI